MKPILNLVAVLMLISGSARASFQSDQQADTTKGLNDYFRDYFTMGVAVSPQSLEGDQARLILQHFGSLTAENVMKPALIHPEENRYTWENADRIAAFARSNGLKLRGHTLVWHQQTPAWFFLDNGQPASKELALSRLKEHIMQVAGRYKGQVYAWDVVNEAIDDGQENYRQSDWYKTCGEEYIANAFKWAHEADPEAKLFYNDYNTENPEKRAKIIRMIRGLIDAGVPIHGIGLQGHWSLNHPSQESLKKSLEEYSKLGIDIQITELDVSVYSGDHRNPDDDVFTTEREQMQLEQYRKIFSVFKEYKNVISAVTFWNVTDQRSWLDNFPVRGRKNYPLLFDQNNNPKKAYWEVVNLVK